MRTSNLLDRLHLVKETGHNKWLACCPAHDDKSPSLAIKQEDDDRILLHCFAGCGAAEILDALGLDFTALYPQTDAIGLPPVCKPFNAQDVLRAVAFELLYAWNCAKAMADGMILNEEERARLLLCATRLQRGWEVANG